MQVLATVLANDWTPAEVFEPREFWGTDSISVAPQWVAADALLTYCRCRLGGQSTDFEIRLLRELRGSESGASEARFGAAVLAISSAINEDQASRLRGELASLANLIKNPNAEETIGILEVNSPQEQEAAALRQRLVAELRAKHGGMRLKQSLEICTEKGMVKLAGTLLSGPDGPTVESPSAVRGQPALINFKESWVKLDSHRSAANGKLFVSDPKIFDEIVEAGRRRDVVKLQVRTLFLSVKASRMEVTACETEARNAAPLSE